MSGIRNCYNLLEEEWIPALWVDGRYSRIGIMEALTQAGRIRQVAASNPMDRIAVLRFLLALLYWCKGNPPDKEPAVSGGQFPPDWFSKLADNSECFNLFGGGRRFFQVPAARRRRTTADLLQEVPSGNNFWHLRHATDGTDGLCPSCCAFGLLRLPLFSVSGLPDLKAGINGAPPVYVLRSGVTLLETLAANWTRHQNLGTPAWVKPDIRPRPDRPVPLLTGLTLLSRRVWLHDPESSGDCIACGVASKGLIRSCESQSAGEQRNDLWDDPHVVYSGAEPRRAARAAGLTAAGRFRMDRPWPYLLADIIESGKFTAPDMSVRVTVVGFATDKAKNIDVWERIVELPAAKALPATSGDTLLQWYDEGKRLERRVSRSKGVGSAVVAAIRPAIEGSVSSRAGALLSGGGGAWEQASTEYRSAMEAIARSLSPGTTSEAHQRRRQIACAVPDMRPRLLPTGKNDRKKGGAK
jgi:CRISPR type I-E-associated protein CasA/Cse1